MLEKYSLNKIYCENSYEAIKDIPDNSIDLIYVDIPYLIVAGGSGGSAISKRIHRVNYDYLKKINDGIDYNIFSDFVRVQPKVNVFIWCSKLQILDILNWFNNYSSEKNKKINTEILVWCKTNPIPATNNMWLPDLEYCLYFREKGVVLNAGYEHKSKFFVSSINKQDKDLFDHPTIKPLEYVKQHILHTTQPNDIVADFFLGSGTTAVAAKELGRRYIGFENDEQYYKIAQDRLLGITQRDRERIEIGQQILF